MSIKDRVCKGICKMATENETLPVILGPVRGQHNPDVFGIETRIAKIKLAREVRKTRETYINEQRKNKMEERELHTKQFTSPVVIAQPEPEYEEDKLAFFTEEDKINLAREIMLQNS